MRKTKNQLSILKNILLLSYVKFEPYPMLTTCVEAIGKSLNLSRCLVHQKDSSGIMTLTQEYTSPNVTAIEIGTTVLTPEAYLSYQSQSTVVSNNMLADERFEGAREQSLLIDLAIKSAASTPIIVKGAVHGLLSFHQCNRQRKWTQEDIDFLDTVAVQLAYVLQSHSLLLEQQKLTHSLTSMNQDLSRLYVQLATKDEQIDRFMHLISHDLRAPIVAIEGLVELLTNQYKNDPPHSKPRRYLELINKSTEQITNLVCQLLDYARLGQSRLNLEQVDTEDLIHEIWQRASLETKDINLEVFSALPVILADRAKLVQVFQNLLENAIKYRKSDGPAIVDITCQEKDDHWQFAINDNGIGFHPSEAEKLFDIFIRLKQTHAKPGSGIGLASVLEIARLHGGTAWAIGRPGNGSTFYFTIAKHITQKPNFSSSSLPK